MTGVESWARLARTVLPPFAVFAGVIGIWYAVTYWALAPRRRFLLPPPHQVVSEGFLDQRTFEEILTALGGTTKVALVGLAIASAIGVVSAVLMAQATLDRALVLPVGDTAADDPDSGDRPADRLLARVRVLVQDGRVHRDRDVSDDH